jgi:integrase
MEADQSLPWGSNRVLLNRQKLDSLKAREGEQRTEWWDESLLGFGVRVYATGKKILTLRYTLRGKRHRKDLGVYRNGPGETGAGIAYSQARQQAAEILGNVRDGIDPFSAATRMREADIRNLEGVCLKYANDRLPLLSAATAREFERIIRREIIPAFGRREPGDIKPEEVEDWTVEIAKDRGPLANRCFAVLRLVFRWGMEKRILTSTPFGAIRKPHPEEARDRVFSNEELRRLFEALKSERRVIAGLWTLLLLTGNRLNETLMMEWSWIDLEDSLLTLPKGVTKSKRQHVVPLVPESLEALDLLRDLADGSRYVFQSPTDPTKATDPTWIQKARARIMQRANIEDGTHHDCRRVIDTNLAKLGVGRDIRSMILNHSVGGRLEKTYNAYDYLKERRKALDRWATKLEQILGYSPTEAIKANRPEPEETHPETWADRKARLAADGRDLVREHRDMQARNRTQGTTPQRIRRDSVGSVARRR